MGGEYLHKLCMELHSLCGHSQREKHPDDKQRLILFIMLILTQITPHTAMKLDSAHAY